MPKASDGSATDMRYYEISIDNGAYLYTSLVNGQTDPNALNVELDISVVGAGTPSQGAYVRIWGVGLQMISQARNLLNKTITVKGGMAHGLPLANPAQAGLLASGIITKPFGNWIGVDQTIDLMFNASAATNGKTGPNGSTGSNHIALNWKKGVHVAGPLQQALAAAFPGVKIKMNLSKQVVAPQDQVAFFANVEQLSHYLARFSQQVVGGSYQGVSIIMQGGGISVSDGPQSGAGVISYTDLIGQPTWIGPATIQFKTVMRADISVLQKVTLPKTFVNTSEGGGATNGNSVQQLAFQGSFQIISVRHVGNFRQPSGESWVSVFEANPVSS